MPNDLRTNLHPEKFFNLTDPVAKELFAGCDFAWEALARIEEYLTKLVGKTNEIHGNVKEGAYLGKEGIYIADSARIEPGAYVTGPAYIGEGVVIRHGAYVRQNVIMLPGSVLGHASEAKNTLFLPDAHAPHFNYIGDSILGQRTNLGAGTKLSNLTLLSERDPLTNRRPTVQLIVDGQVVDTGLEKLGSIIGDDVQTGCNSVMNPGCLIGPRTLVYANVSLRKGFYPADSIIKLRQDSETVERR